MVTKEVTPLARMQNTCAGTRGFLDRIQLMKAKGLTKNNHDRQEIDELINSMSKKIDFGRGI